jgi:hypothetical protein
MLADFVGGPMHGQSRCINRVERVLRFGQMPEVQIGYFDCHDTKPDFNVIEYELIHRTETFCVYFIDRHPRYWPPINCVEHWISMQQLFEQHVVNNCRDQLQVAAWPAVFVLDQIALRKAMAKAGRRIRKLKRRP